MDKRPFSLPSSLVSFRFGRGLGLRYVRCVGAWRPAEGGRQEVTVVRVFEGQNIVHRDSDASSGGGGGSLRVGVRATNHQTNTRGKAGVGSRNQGVTGAANRDFVVVATITPDKLVRLWSTGGVALGNLDQVSM